MILKDIINHADFDEILETVENYADSATKKNFAKNAGGYSFLLDKLKETPAGDSDYIVCVETYSHKDQESYDVARVYLKSKIHDEDKMSYCFCLSDKADWVSFEVLSDQEPLYYHRLLVACLYDMTFYGFTEEQVEESKRMLAGKPFDPNNAEEVVHHLNEQLLDLDIKNNTDCFCYTNYTTDESISFNNQILWSLNEDSDNCVFDVVKKKFQEIIDRMTMYTRFFQRS